jgi:rod shape-determining protein MreD
MKSQFKICIIIAVSFLLAMMLTILPLPNWANWLRPAWVLIVLIYWVFTMPNIITIEIAWFIGLLLDALTGTTLGEHALALVIITYLINKFYFRMLLSSLWQQTLTIFIIVVIYYSLIFCIQGLIGFTPITWQYWLSSLTSAILWPWLFTLLHGLCIETE